MVHRLKYIKWKNYMLQFFSVVYTQIIVLGTQWPQHGTHALTPWSNSAELQAQLLLYTQIAVLKHNFFQNTTYNSLHLAQFSWRKSLVFTRNTLSFKILKSIALLCTLTHIMNHMGKHLSHSFTFSNQSYGRRMWRYSNWCFSWMDLPC